MAHEERVAEALRAHRSALRAFVRARVPGAEVDDVLQTAALRAVEHAPTLKAPEHVRAWLYRIHRNVITDAARSRARGGRLVPADMDALPEAAAPGEAEICGCSLGQMHQVRPSYASILALVDTGGASLAEAAQQLGISVQNATVRLHRARKALRQRMLEHCGVTNVRDCLDCRCADDGCCAV